MDGGGGCLLLVRESKRSRARVTRVKYPPSAFKLVSKRQCTSLCNPPHNLASCYVSYRIRTYNPQLRRFCFKCRLNTEKLKEPAVQKALVSEVKKAVSPLAFKSQELQYTLLA